MLESQETRIYDAPCLSAEQVAQYLLEHPDFFLQYPDIVERIDVEVSGEGVFSLGQLQQRRQRQKILDLEADIERLRDVASNNDKTFYQFMSLPNAIASMSLTRSDRGSTERIGRATAAQGVLTGLFE